MTARLDARLAALERAAGAGGDLAPLVEQATALLSAAPCEEPLPAPDAILATFRAGVPVVCRGHVIAVRGGQRFVRTYAGVDLRRI